ncbi:MAG TPA: hypothetical protein VIL37_09030 [Natronosporangium sp.]
MTADRLTRSIAGATIGALFFGGCTAGRESEAQPPSPPAITATPAAPTASQRATVPPLEPIEFTFQAPDEPCPPVSSLETLPVPDGHRYESFEPFVTDDDGYFSMICSYNIVGARGANDTIIEDHASVSAQIQLYRSWEESPTSRLSFWPEFPLWSEDLADWARASVGDGDRYVRWEGCGEDTPCEGSEEPTVRTYASRWDFRGHVGNLDFNDVTVQFIGEQIPPDVELIVTEILRDFVLAVVDHYEHAS